VHGRIANSVEDGEEDQASCADKGAEDGQAHQNLLTSALVWHQPASVSEKALCEEGEVKGDGGDGGTGDEERLHLIGANVADVGKRHVGVNGRIPLTVGADDPEEQHAQKCPQPDEAREDWKPLCNEGVRSTQIRSRSGIDRQALTQYEKYLKMPEVAMLAMLAMLAMMAMMASTST
jgi:hypothetical protein